MTVQTLIDAGLFSIASQGDTSKKISEIFCCDMLSVAMGKAPENCAWVTVMANRNTLAVASLCDAACIILAEGVQMNPNDLECAEKEGISVLATELPIFKAALQIHQML